VPAARISDRRSIIFADGQERALSPDTMRFGSTDEQYTVRLDRGNGWIMIGGGPTSPLTDVGQHWVVSVKETARLDLDLFRTTLVFAGNAVRFERSIWRIVQSRANENVIIVLLSLNDADPYNVRAFDATGRELWKIGDPPKSEGARAGYYYIGNRNDGSIYARNVAGFAVFIDPNTGVISRAVESR
jgi:hypothetical protein